MSLRKRHPCARSKPTVQAHKCAEAASLSTRAGRAFHADTVACTIQSVKLTGRTRLPDMIAARSLRGRGAQEAKCRSENTSPLRCGRARSANSRGPGTQACAPECAEEASLSTRPRGCDTYHNYQSYDPVTSRGRLHTTNPPPGLCFLKSPLSVQFLCGALLWDFPRETARLGCCWCTEPPSHEAAGARDEGGGRGGGGGRRGGGVCVCLFPKQMPLGV
jgi:hypothetical protein